MTAAEYLTQVEERASEVRMFHSHETGNSQADVPRLVRMLREYSELIGMFQFWSHCDLRRADPNADYYALRSRLKTLSEYLTRVDAIANE